ncbi:hypothetical protein CLOM_g2276 [Closterium sp. NIES-68]|nr:hypothetical protein CLOM_g2276 [Closterium sp. NIES-68]GJP84077.1 hypothetical protein CLOP_g14167 [Closterium sp. NIES-67]
METMATMATMATVAAQPEGPQHQYRQRDERSSKSGGAGHSSAAHRSNARALSLPRVFSGRLEHLSIPSSPGATSASGRSPAHRARGKHGENGACGGADEGEWVDGHVGCAGGLRVWRKHGRDGEQGEGRTEEERRQRVQKTDDSVGGESDASSRGSDNSDDSSLDIDEGARGRGVTSCGNGSGTAGAGSGNCGNGPSNDSASDGTDDSSDSSTYCDEATEANEGNEATVAQAADRTGSKAMGINGVFQYRLEHLAIPSPRLPPDTPDSASIPDRSETPHTASPRAGASASPCISATTAAAAAAKATVASVTAAEASAVLPPLLSASSTPSSSLAPTPTPSAPPPSLPLPLAPLGVAATDLQLTNDNAGSNATSPQHSSWEVSRGNSTQPPSPQSAPSLPGNPEASSSGGRGACSWADLSPLLASPHPLMQQLEDASPGSGSGSGRGRERGKERLLVAMSSLARLKEVLEGEREKQVRALRERQREEREQRRLLLYGRSVSAGAQQCGKEGQQQQVQQQQGRQEQGRQEQERQQHLQEQERLQSKAVPQQPDKTAAGEGSGGMAERQRERVTELAVSAAVPAVRTPAAGVASETAAPPACAAPSAPASETAAAAAALDSSTAPTVSAAACVPAREGSIHGSPPAVASPSPAATTPHTPTSHPTSPSLSHRSRWLLSIMTRSNSTDSGSCNSSSRGGSPATTPSPTDPRPFSPHTNSPHGFSPLSPHPQPSTAPRTSTPTSPAHPAPSPRRPAASPSRLSLRSLLSPRLGSSLGVKSGLWVDSPSADKPGGRVQLMQSALGGARSVSVDGGGEGRRDKGWREKWGPRGYGEFPRTESEGSRAGGGRSRLCEGRMGCREEEGGEVAGPRWEIEECGGGEGSELGESVGGAEEQAEEKREGRQAHGERCVQTSSGEGKVTGQGEAKGVVTERKGGGRARGMAGKSDCRGEGARMVAVGSQGSGRDHQGRAAARGRSRSVSPAARRSRVDEREFELAFSHLQVSWKKT